MIDTEMPETSDTRVAAPPAAEFSLVDVLGEDGGDAIFVKELPKVTASLVVALQRQKVLWRVALTKTETKANIHTL